jgi:hypothetical protein
MKKIRDNEEGGRLGQRHGEGKGSTRGVRGREGSELITSIDKSERYDEGSD